MEKRSTKFYRENESKVMKSLGLTPTKNSGAGAVEKADGQNEHVICELKSTERKSYGFKFEDFWKLEEQAIVCNKMPVFALQDLTNNDVYLIMKADTVEDLAKYLKTGKYVGSAVLHESVGIGSDENTCVRKRSQIRGGTDMKDILQYKKEERKAY